MFFQELQVELAWTMVVYTEKEIEHARKTQDAIGEKVQEIDNDIEAQDEIDNNFSAKKAKIQAKIQSLAAKSSEIEEEARELSKEVPVFPFKQFLLQRHPLKLKRQKQPRIPFKKVKCYVVPSL